MFVETYKEVLKFSKFYLNRFRPLTVGEDKDIKRARDTYRTSTLIGAITMGFISLRYRKYKISQTQYYEAPRDMNLLTGFNTDGFFALGGYVGAHLVCCDYIYKHRQYVIERLHFERNNGFSRDNYDLAAATA